MLDPIYKMLGSRDENNASDVTEILMSLERAAELTGAAVLFSRHYAKGSATLKESTDRMSGSGVWIRDPDSYLAMTRHEENALMNLKARVITVTLRMESEKSDAKKLAWPSPHCEISLYTIILWRYT